MFFDFRQQQNIFPFSEASKVATGPTQHPMKQEPKDFSPEVKRPGHEAESLSSADNND
jgi:hypothetical protein